MKRLIILFILFLFVIPVVHAAPKECNEDGSSSSTGVRCDGGMYKRNEDATDGTTDSCQDGSNIGDYMHVENIYVDSSPSIYGQDINITCEICCYSSATKYGIAYYDETNGWSLIDSGSCLGGSVASTCTWLENKSKIVNIDNPTGQHTVRCIEAYNTIPTTTCGTDADVTYSDTDDLNITVVKVKKIGTDADSNDISIGNDGEIYIDNGIHNVGMGAPAATDAELTVVSTDGNAIRASSSAEGKAAVFINTTGSADALIGINVLYVGGHFASNKDIGLEIFAPSTYPLEASTIGGNAAVFTGGNVGLGVATPLSDLSVMTAGVAGAGIFAENSICGVYGNSSGGANAVGVFGDGGQSGNGINGTGGSTGVTGLGAIGVKGISYSDSDRYGLLGTGTPGIYGLYGQSDDTHYGYIGSAVYGMYGRGTIGVFAEGNPTAANLPGDIIITTGRSIETGPDDENIVLADPAVSWYGYTYGGSATFHGDGVLEDSLINAGGVNISQHLVAEPIIGKWYPTSSEDNSTLYWNWTGEEFNTNSNVFAVLSNGYQIGVYGNNYPGYYQICWKLMYNGIDAGLYIDTYLTIGGSYYHETRHDGTDYTYVTDSACVDWYFDSYRTVALRAVSTDDLYTRYGSATGTYSWMSIRKLN